MAGQPTPPPHVPPPRNKALLRRLLTIGFPSKGLIKPLFLGGLCLGGVG